MYYRLFFFFFFFPQLITLTTMHCSTHWSAPIKRPLLILPGYLADIKIGAELFRKSTVINPMISERRREERKPFIGESGVSVCVCVRVRGVDNVGHNPASDRGGGGASIVYREAYAPSLHTDTNYSKATFYQPVREG